MVALGSLADRAQCGVEALFVTLEGLLESRVGRGGAYGTRLRITDELRDDSAWETVGQLWSQADPSFGQLLEGLDQLAMGLDAALRAICPHWRMPVIDYWRYGAC